jgi:hypothetical protein
LAGGRAEAVKRELSYRHGSIRQVAWRRWNGADAWLKR